QQVIVKNLQHFSTLELELHMHHINAKFLNHLRDAQLKRQIAENLFESAQKINFTQDDYLNRFHLRALAILVQQNDIKLRERAFKLCQDVIERALPCKDQACVSLASMGLALHKVEAGKVLAHKILSELKPNFEKAVTSSADDFYDVEDVLDFFMRV